MRSKQKVEQRASIEALSSTPEHTHNPFVHEREYTRNQVLTEIIEIHARKINEGKNAIILKVDTNQLQIGIRDVFLQKAPEESNESALKTFKLNNHLLNQHEYDMQKQAEILLKEKEDDPSFAQVPRTWSLDEVQLTSGAMNQLLSYNLTQAKEGKASMIVMDFIPGDDLATALYREVIKRHPKTVHLANHVAEMDYVELSEIVGRTLDMRTPGGKSANAAERAFEDARVQSENSNKLFAYLEKTGFRIHPSIIEQISNTMKLFHKNGFYVRDAHHRNVMVVGEIDASTTGSMAPKVFLIDFATAVVIQKGEDPYYDQLSGNNLLSDDFVLNTLKQLNASSSVTNESAKLREDLAKLSVRILRSKQHMDFRVSLRMKLRNEHADIWNVYQLSPSSSNRLDAFLAMLDAEILDGAIESAFVKQALETSMLKFSLPEQVRIRLYLS